MLSGKVLNKKSESCDVSLVVKLELVSWMAAEEEGSAHKESAATLWDIAGCIVRVMRALIAEPCRRSHETACHADTVCYSELCLRGLEVQVGDRTVDGYRQTCNYGTR